METLVPLAILAGTSGAFLFASRKKKQGFQNVMGKSTQNALREEDKDFINSSASRYNPLSNLLNPFKNVLLKEDSNVSAVENELKDSLRTTKVKKGRGGNYNVTGNPMNNIQLNDGSSRVQNLTKKCESVNVINCDLFDDKVFADNCGMCHEDGINSKGRKITGGLFITDDDKVDMEELSKNLGSKKVNYQPSIGKCGDKMFSITKEQCIRLKNQLECKKKQSFGTQGCSQCPQDDYYTYLDSDVLKTNAKLMIGGSGTASIRRSKKDDFSVVDYTLTPSLQEVPLTEFQEGDEIIITIDGQASYIFGHLEGNTLTGKFLIDMVRLISVDSVTGLKPRVSGVRDIGDQSYNEIRPGKGRYNMRLVLVNTFTFVAPTEEEAIPCATTPYIGTEGSAKILSSGVCYKSGQIPGKYSLECLQNVFVNAGCEVRGEGYPSSSSRAEKLMRDKSGKLLTHGEIANIVYSTSQIAYSGVNEAGNKLSIPEWDEVNRWCTGKRIVSPCTSQGDGPHSAECLAYLWLNKGAEDDIENGEGPTYVSNVKNSSLTGLKPQFCTTKGYMSPVLPDGTYNDVRVKNWNTVGRTDLQWVKWAMDYMYKSANDNTLTDEERRPWVVYCYGIDFANNTIKDGEAIIPKPDVKSRKYKESPGVFIMEPMCPEGSWSPAGGYGRCQKPSLEEAINLCNKLPECTGVTRDNAGYEPRKGRLDTSWSGALSWVANEVGNYSNSLDTKHGRNKSGFIPKKNYTMPTNVIMNTPVTIIGTFGIGPWYTDYGDQWGENAKIKYFQDDRKAVWIWPNNIITTPVYAVYKFYPLMKKYINKTDNYIEATVDLCVDYWVRFYFNGSPAGRADQMAAHEKFNINIPPGENLFHFDVCGDIADSVHKKNGFICIVRDSISKEVLFRTDNTWIGGTFK